jgi:hypothetical protein
MENKDLEVQIKSKQELVTPENPIGITDTNFNKIENRLQNINEVAKLIKKFLIPNVDYGVIPGTKKPFLFKSGAQKITMLYGLRVDFELINEFKGYRKFKKTEVHIEEHKYKATLYTFTEEKKVAEGIGHISTTEKGKKDFPTNTLIKVCKKRAMVDATLQIAALGEIFTQDKDIVEELKGMSINLSKYQRLGIYSEIYNILGFDRKQPENKMLI